jgi:hypothetical protein
MFIESPLNLRSIVLSLGKLSGIRIGPRALTASETFTFVCNLPN